MQRHVARVALVAAALFGALGLFRFAYLITHRHSARLTNETVHDELVAIYAPAALIEFAKTHDSFATNAELRSLIARAGLQNCWFVVESRATQEDGTINELPVILRFDEKEWLFPLRTKYLQTMAGKPPDDNHAVAQIIVIPELLETSEPRGVLDKVIQLSHVNMRY